MSLRDTIETQRSAGTPCKVGKLLEAGDQLAQELEDVLADPEILVAEIEKALAKEMEDYPRYQTIGKHRRGECCCR